MERILERRKRILIAVGAILAVIVVQQLVWPAQVPHRWKSARTRFRAAFAVPQETGFDWLSTQNIIAFGDSFSSNHAEGIEAGRPVGLDKHTGLKWCDYLCATYHPQARYYNYASDGATIDTNLVPPRLESSGTLDDQLRAFSSVSSSIAWKSDETLFVVVMGINDVREMARREFPSPHLEDTATALPGAFLSRLESLYDLGARHFLTFTLSPLEHAPKYASSVGIGHNVSSFLSAGVAAYNTALPRAIASWSAGRQGSVLTFPWDALFEIITDDDEVFGFTDHERYETAGDQGRLGMMYQDPSHLTWPVAQILARSVNGFLVRHSSSWIHAQKSNTGITVT